MDRVFPLNSSRGNFLLIFCISKLVLCKSRQQRFPILNISVLYSQIIKQCSACQSSWEQPTFLPVVAISYTEVASGEWRPSALQPVLRESPVLLCLHSPVADHNYVVGRRTFCRPRLARQKHLWVLWRVTQCSPPADTSHISIMWSVCL